MSTQIEKFDFTTISCDENKHHLNFVKHGVDLYEAALIFGGPVLTKIDDREGKNYKEIRWISIGMNDDDCFVTIHTMRGSDLRMISAWRAGTRDRQRYREAIAR